MTIAVVTVVIVTYFSKNNLTPQKPMRFLRAAFRDLAMFFLFMASSGRSNYFDMHDSIKRIFVFHSTELVPKPGPIYKSQCSWMCPVVCDMLRDCSVIVY